MGTGNLYNAVNGVNQATFWILPMLDRHPDEYPRFRDCFVNALMQIVVLTRVGGGNRNCGFGEEKLYKDPNFEMTFDLEEDNTYGFYVFRVPEKWKSDFDKIMNGKKPSDEYVEQMCKVYPKLADKFKETIAKMNLV